MIAIPDSVTFYWADPINRAALNVLGAGTDVPGDLSLPEAERFELAQLAAQRVRVEYWGLLRSLWEAIWGEAVRAQMSAARLLSLGEHRAFATTYTEAFADPSVSYAWQNFGTSGVFALPGRGHLFTALWLIDDARELQLQFYLIDNDGSCGLSDGLDLGPNWTDDGASRRTIQLQGLPPRSDGSFDIQAATARASEAVAALARASA